MKTVTEVLMLASNEHKNNGNVVDDIDEFKREWTGYRSSVRYSRYMPTLSNNLNLFYDKYKEYQILIDYDGGACTDIDDFVSILFMIATLQLATDRQIEIHRAHTQRRRHLFSFLMRRTEPQTEPRLEPDMSILNTILDLQIAKRLTPGVNRVMYSDGFEYDVADSSLHVQRARRECLELRLEFDQIYNMFKHLHRSKFADARANRQSPVGGCGAGGDAGAAGGDGGDAGAAGGAGGDATSETTSDAASVERGRSRSIDSSQRIRSHSHTSAGSGPRDRTRRRSHSAARSQHTKEARKKRRKLWKYMAANTCGKEHVDYITQEPINRPFVTIRMGKEKYPACYDKKQLLQWLRMPENKVANWVQNVHSNPMNDMGYGGKPGAYRFVKLPEGTWITNDSADLIEQSPLTRF